ncbi:MAG: chemotaxis protein CheD [Tabrizicola sp.]|uniref:chemotaxis protein CheD n=1 Tax=Tabrizicola sp. TaxID=2005166 RepID=UPI002ABBD178|nr:chemotaxis protein CheD [Tabrizicola sp.]MDZ4085889.1 chemotaxis protein CheD [Tabrizicola sp.]
MDIYARDAVTYIHVVQGDYAVSDRENTILTTILGSCVSTCISDPIARVGGMNHFLLPGNGSGDTQSIRYGLYAMELLINGLLKMGASKNRLAAKLFGGASMSDGFGRIGEANGKFAVDFLANEGIPCIAQSLGGTNARRIRFTPTTGYAQQLIVQQDELKTVPPARASSRSETDVTFF